MAEGARGGESEGGLVQVMRATAAEVTMEETCSDHDGGSRMQAVRSNGALHTRRVDVRGLGGFAGTGSRRQQAGVGDEGRGQELIGRGKQGLANTSTKWAQESA